MKRALTFALGLAAAGALALGGWLTWAPYPVERLEERPASWRLLDADGGTLREAVSADGARIRWTPLEAISPLVIAGTVAVEDKRFWTHGGVDAVAVGRAVKSALSAGEVVSGASTLTMQLARMLGGHRRTPAGKAAQALDALRLERAAGKAVLLEQYLNRAPYGAGAIGAEAASWRYFGKPSRHLSLAEAALIAGLPQSPNGHNPFRDPDSAKRRQAAVLERMLATGAVARGEYDLALAEPLIFRPPAGEPPPAMHFTDYALERAASGGAPGVVRTTLDADLLYARVDVVPDASGQLAIMEVELVEPSLFFAQHAGALERMAGALVREAGRRPADA